MPASQQGPLIEQSASDGEIGPEGDLGVVPAVNSSGSN